MRLILSIVVFIIVGVTVAGSVLIVALSMPELGLAKIGTIGWSAGVGFLLAAPVSYWIAGMLMERARRHIG